MFESVRPLGGCFRLDLNRADSELVPRLDHILTGWPLGNHDLFPECGFSTPQAFLNLALLFQIPVIAIMATGGGIRAMTSLYGQLAGLRELGLLDCISYITGASGSTW